MPDIRDILLNADFNYQKVSVDNLSYGDNYLKVNIDEIEDIFVVGEHEGMGLDKKYDQLRFVNGHIHLQGGLTLSIEHTKIKSLRLRNKYIQRVNLKNRKAIELELGSADKELMDGITWVVDCIIEAKVLLYKKLKLYIHLDPTTDVLKEIRFGDVDEKGYA